MFIYKCISRCASYLQLQSGYTNWNYTFLVWLMVLTMQCWFCNENPPLIAPGPMIYKDGRLDMNTDIRHGFWILTRTWVFEHGNPPIYWHEYMVIYVDFFEICVYLTYKYMYNVFIHILKKVEFSILILIFFFFKKKEDRVIKWTLEYIFLVKRVTWHIPHLVNILM